jgi:hypothetical protein
MAPGFFYVQGLDSQGLDSQGLDSQGLDSQGLDSQGLDSQGLDSQGLDSQGLDSRPSGPKLTAKNSRRFLSLLTAKLTAPTAKAYTVTE